MFRITLADIHTTTEVAQPATLTKIILGHMDIRQLQDIYISSEALKDIKLWGIDQIDEQTVQDILKHPMWVTSSLSVDFYTNDIDCYI